jgi:hypothetical protein
MTAGPVVEHKPRHLVERAPSAAGAANTGSAENVRGAKATPRLGLRWQVTVATVLMFASVVGLTSWPPQAPGRPLPAGLARPASGLVMADALSRSLTPGQLQGSYNLDGSAGPSLGWAWERKSGLYVGIKAHSGWAGWFASTIHAAGPGVAWHAVMTGGVPPEGSEQRVLGVFAVQTASTQTSGAINYIVVAMVAKGNVYRWVVGYGHGIVAGATTDVLWSSRFEQFRPGARWLPSEAITVVTDGRSRLSVWLGRRVVFSSDGLRLRMPPPFQAYLEVQSRAPAFQARFSDFWVARTAPLRVGGLAPGTAVTLQTGSQRWRATAARDGTASLALPAYALSGQASLTLGSRTFRRVNYSGGDVLRPAR